MPTAASIILTYRLPASTGYWLPSTGYHPSTVYRLPATTRLPATARLPPVSSRAKPDTQASSCAAAFLLIPQAADDHLGVSRAAPTPCFCKTACSHGRRWTGSRWDASAILQSVCCFCHSGQHWRGGCRLVPLGPSLPPTLRRSTCSRVRDRRAHGHVHERD